MIPMKCYTEVSLWGASNDSFLFLTIIHIPLLQLFQIPQPIFSLMIKLMKIAEEMGHIQATWHLHCISNKRPIKPILPPYNKYKKLAAFSQVLQGKILSVFPSYSSILKYQFEIAVTEACERYEIYIEKSFRPFHAKETRGAVINLSNIHIPDDIKLLLSYGPKFIITPQLNSLNIINFLCRFESCVTNHFHPGVLNETYKHLYNFLLKHIKGSLNTEQIWLAFLLYRIKKFIRFHPNIFITNSDKGKHTVLINEDLYVSKGNSLVLSSDYSQISDFSLEPLIEKNNLIVKKLVALGTIKSGKSFLLTRAFLAKFYVLIKIHKKDFPPRPIFSACDTVGFNLSQLMVTILQDIFPEKGFHVNNSLEVKEKLSDILISDDESIVSFDAKAMFTSITIDLVLNIINSRSSMILRKWHIDSSTINLIFSFLLKDCAIFQWQNNHYKQNDSLAMGSPLSPILAKIVMTHLFETITPKIFFPLKFLCVYVDDTLCILETKHIFNMLSLINSFHPKLQFTVETETNKSINFLDIQVSRNKQNILTKWYRKPFSSDRLLNFFSGHKKGTIINVATTFIKKCLLLSSPKFFKENRLTLTQILEENCFPLTLIIRLLHENYTLMKPISFRDKTHKNTITYSAISHIDGLTAKIKNIIQPFSPKLHISHAPFSSKNQNFLSNKR